MNGGATTLLSIKWVDTERGAKGRGAPTGCAGAVPKSLPSEVALDSEGEPETCAQPRAGAGGELRRASCASSFRELSLPALTPGVSRGRGEEGSRRWAEAAAARWGRGSPEGPQPETRRDLGPGQGPFRRAETSKKREPATRRRRGAPLSRAAPGALAAWGRSGGGAEAGAVLPQQVLPEARAGRFPPLSLAPGRACEYFVLPEAAAGARGDPVRRAAQPSPRARGAQPQLCSSGSREPRPPEASRQFLCAPPPAPTPDLRGASLTLSPVARPPLRSSSHRAPLRKLPALPEAAAIWAPRRAPPPPHSSPESGGQWSRWPTCREAAVRSRWISNVQELPSLAQPQT